MEPPNHVNSTEIQGQRTLESQGFNFSISNRLFELRSGNEFFRAFLAVAVSSSSGEALPAATKQVWGCSRPQKTILSVNGTPWLTFAPLIGYPTLSPRCPDCILERH